MKVSTDIFIMGIMQGWGPCLSFCLPIIIPLIVGTRQRNVEHSAGYYFLSGLGSILVFSLSRLFAYIVLAVIAVTMSHIVVREFYETRFGYFFSPIVGIIVVLFGLLLIFNKNPDFKFCKHFIKNPLQNNMKGILILGLVIGFSPCIPLFGVLAYIAFESKTLWDAVFYGLCFGAGTMLTPLIPIGVLAGGIPLLIKWRMVFDILSRVCGGYLVYIGMKLAL